MTIVREVVGRDANGTEFYRATVPDDVAEWGKQYGYMAKISDVSPEVPENYVIVKLLRDFTNALLDRVEEIGRPLTESERKTMQALYIEPGGDYVDPLSRFPGFGWKYTADPE